MRRPVEPAGNCVGGGGIIGNGSMPNRQFASAILVPGTQPAEFVGVQGSALLMLNVLTKIVGFCCWIINSGIFRKVWPKYRPYPPRKTCLPFPLMSHANPRRGLKSLLSSWGKLAARGLLIALSSRYVLLLACALVPMRLKSLSQRTPRFKVSLGLNFQSS